MKHKQQTAAIGILAGFFLIGLCVSATSGQNTQWKEKIETVDGVKVVRNPKEPLYGDIKLDLEEDLKIGKPDDPNYLFYRVRGLDVDKDGNIYVGDMSNFRIQKFDKAGKYLLTFGRKGQGPGEFDLPTAVHIEEKTGNILVQDQAYTIEIFAPDGKPIRSMRLETAFRDFRIASDGTIVALLTATLDTKAFHRLSKIGPDGKVAQIYADVPYTQHIERIAGGMSSVTTGFELAIQFDLLDHQSYVYGYSKDYALTIIDLSGKALCRFGKDETAPKFASKEKAGFKRIPLPEFKPYFYAIYTDDLGRIYVQRNKTWAEEDVRQKEIDVFSRDGYFLYRTKLPKYTHVIRNGYVYALEVNEDEIIKRFKIKNWAAFKSGL
jgi:hypothetical protein